MSGLIESFLIHQTGISQRFIPNTEISHDAYFLSILAMFVVTVKTSFLLQPHYFDMD